MVDGIVVAAAIGEGLDLARLLHGAALPGGITEIRHAAPRALTRANRTGRHRRNAQLHCLHLRHRRATGHFVQQLLHRHCRFDDPGQRARSHRRQAVDVRHGRTDLRQGRTRHQSQHQACGNKCPTPRLREMKFHNSSLPHQYRHDPEFPPENPSNYRFVTRKIPCWQHFWAVSGPQSLDFCPLWPQGRWHGDLRISIYP